MSSDQGLGIRRIFAAVCLLAIVLLRIDWRVLQLLVMDRAPLARAFRVYPDRLWPQFPRFLEGVREHTRDGDSIAIVVPDMRWDEGYSYAFYRASYFLTGRRVIPLSDDHDRAHPENLRDAQFLAAWGVTPPASNPVVWSGEGGVLLRRR